MTDYIPGALIELDLRGAALDGESRAFATDLLDAWDSEPPRFSLTIRSANTLGGPIPPNVKQIGADGRAPTAILSLWPVWPWRAPAPVVLFIGEGAETLRGWNPHLWRARRCGLVLVPSRREKVELQVLRRFRRDRIWSLDTQPVARNVESALIWMAAMGASSPSIAHAPPAHPIL